MLRPRRLRDDHDRRVRALPAGSDDNLPKRPILITFDDGRLDSYRGADKILAEHGFRATMFAIAGYVEEDSPFYLNWDELRRMAKSRRWDVQEHAGIGHIERALRRRRARGAGVRLPAVHPGRGPRDLRGFKRRVQPRHPVGEAHDDRAATGLRAAELRGPVRKLRPGRRHERRAHPAASCRGSCAALPGRVHDRPPVYSTPASSHSALPRIEIHADIRHGRRSTAGCATGFRTASVRQPSAAPARSSVRLIASSSSARDMPCAEAA